MCVIAAYGVEWRYTSIPLLFLHGVDKDNYACTLTFIQ